jgi:hypothetical protein
MSIRSNSPIALISRAAAPAAVIAFAAFILLRFPPEQYGFYPRCPVYSLLHLECPGCGTTRAIAALLRGHFTEALRLNALATSLFPPATIYAAICYRRYLRGDSLQWPQLPQAAVYAWLTVAAIFTILRNLPLRLL